MPFDVLARGAARFAAHRGTLLAASISYYAFFSLFPLTVLVLSIFGIVIRDEAMHARVLDAIVDFLPVEDDTVEASLRRVAEIGPTLTIFSLAGSAWTAAALSAAVRSALNLVFESDQRRPFLRGKLIDYALLPIIAVPLLGGVVISAVARLARDQLGAWVPVLGELIGLTWAVVSLGVPLVLSFTAFLLIYWLLPNRRLRFRYLWPGALLAALAFELLKAGFAFYLANFAAYDVLYGSLGSVIVLLFWVFLTANILIFGGEVAAAFPHVLHHEPPERDAAEGDWKRSLGKVVLGLVMVVEEEEPEAERARRAAGEAAGEGRQLDLPLAVPREGGEEES